VADLIKSVTYEAMLEILQEIDIAIDGATNPQVLLKIPGLSGLLSPTTTPNVTKAWLDQRTLAGTAETLDLTALSRTNLPAVNFSTGSLKLQFLLVLGATGNAARVLFSRGTTNPYDLGPSTWITSAEIGGFALQYGNAKWGTVGASTKNILVSGSIGDVYTILLAAGL